jgi:hypothetical protein
MDPAAIAAGWDVVIDASRRGRCRGLPPVLPPQRTRSTVDEVVHNWDLAMDRAGASDESMFVAVPRPVEPIPEPVTVSKPDDLDAFLAKVASR